MYNVRHNTPQKRGLFNSAGKKIKNVSVAIFVIGLIVSIAVGIYYLVILIQNLRGGTADIFTDGLAKELILAPAINVLLFPVGGGFASWIVSLLVYGYGDLIDKNT